MTVKTALTSAKVLLNEAGIEAAGFDAKQLICHCLGTKPSRILFLGDRELSEPEKDEFYTLCSRRMKRYPLQYILGLWEFYSFPFIVGEGVLIPRADTEVLVDSALEYLKTNSNASIIDLGSGSGCISVSIKKNAPGVSVEALEKSDKAITFLKKNITLNEVDILVTKGDIFKGSSKKYDLIVSNPPYIKSSDLNSLMPEVGFEPESALGGGEDGLIFYRAITEKWVKSLKSGGKLMVEIGFDQADDVINLFSTAGLLNIIAKKDINGIRRVIIGTMPLSGID